jgi:hypothetical protein
LVKTVSSSREFEFVSCATYQIRTPGTTSCPSLCGLTAKDSADPEDADPRSLCHPILRKTEENADLFVIKLTRCTDEPRFREGADCDLL